jgi:hypothetical protein
VPLDDVGTPIDHPGSDLCAADIYAYRELSHLISLAPIADRIDGLAKTVPCTIIWAELGYDSLSVQGMQTGLSGHVEGYGELGVSSLPHLAKFLPGCNVPIRRSFLDMGNLVACCEVTPSARRCGKGNPRMRATQDGRDNSEFFSVL